jgi:hypothetical protein
MRDFLTSIKHSYADENRFGSGPNWKMRVARASLQNMSLNPDLLKHGITREVFVCRLAANAEKYLRGEINRPSYPNLLSVDEIAAAAKERWIMPRSFTRDEWKGWRRSMVENLVQAQVTK